MKQQLKTTSGRDTPTLRNMVPFVLIYHIPNGWATHAPPIYSQMVYYRDLKLYGWIGGVILGDVLEGHPPTPLNVEMGGKNPKGWAWVAHPLGKLGLRDMLAEFHHPGFKIVI